MSGPFLLRHLQSRLCRRAVECEWPGSAFFPLPAVSWQTDQSTHINLPLHPLHNLLLGLHTVRGGEGVRSFVNDTLLFPLLYMFALCCCHMHQSGRFGSASPLLLPPSPQSVAWFMLLPTRVACSIARRHTTQAVSALASFAG